MVIMMRALVGVRRVMRAKWVGTREKDTGEKGVSLTLHRLRGALTMLSLGWMSPLLGWTASIFRCCWETLHSNSRGRREGLWKVKVLLEEQPTQVGVKNTL